jgi:hypothetical protein
MRVTLRPRRHLQKRDARYRLLARLKPGLYIRTEPFYVSPAGLRFPIFDFPVLTEPPDGFA